MSHREEHVREEDDHRHTKNGRASTKTLFPEEEEESSDEPRRAPSRARTKGHISNPRWSNLDATKEYAFPSTNPLTSHVRLGSATPSSAPLGTTFTPLHCVSSPYGCGRSLVSTRPSCTVKVSSEVSNISLRNPLRLRSVVPTSLVVAMRGSEDQRNPVCAEYGTTAVLTQAGATSCAVDTSMRDAEIIATSLFRQRWNDHDPEDATIIASQQRETKNSGTRTAMEMMCGEVWRGDEDRESRVVRSSWDGKASEIAKTCAMAGIGSTTAQMRMPRSHRE